MNIIDFTMDMGIEQDTAEQDPLSGFDDWRSRSLV